MQTSPLATNKNWHSSTNIHILRDKKRRQSSFNHFLYQVCKHVASVLRLKKWTVNSTKGPFIKYGWGGAGGFRQIFRERTSGPPFKLCEKFSGPPFRPREKIGSPPLFFQYFTSCHLTINNYKLNNELNNEHRGLICNWWLSHHCLADFVYRNLLCTRPAPG